MIKNFDNMINWIYSKGHTSYLESLCLMSQTHSLPFRFNTCFFSPVSTAALWPLLHHLTDFWNVCYFSWQLIGGGGVALLSWLLWQQLQFLTGAEDFIFYVPVTTFCNTQSMCLCVCASNLLHSAWLRLKLILDHPSASTLPWYREGESLFYSALGWQTGYSFLHLQCRHFYEIGAARFGLKPVFMIVRSLVFLICIHIKQRFFAGNLGILTPFRQNCGDLDYFWTVLRVFGECCDRLSCTVFSGCFDRLEIGEFESFLLWSTGAWAVNQCLFLREDSSIRGF